jgi:membrane protein DedA with SNARE-associated domain
MPARCARPAVAGTTTAVAGRSYRRVANRLAWVLMLLVAIASTARCTWTVLSALDPSENPPEHADSAHEAMRVTAAKRRNRRRPLPRADTLGGVTFSAQLAAELANAPDSGLTGWVVGLMDTLGLFGAGLAVGMDNLFPPIPSEIILPLAGFAASQGTFSLAGALIATTLGSVIGAVILYGLGRGFGRERAAWVFAKVPLLKVSDLEKTEAWFAKHGAKAVFFGRMVPIFRSLISLPAGVERMNFALFFMLTTAGSLLWNSIFVISGYKLGENWDKVEPYADTFQKFVIMAVLVVIVAFVVVRVRELKRGDA